GLLRDAVPQVRHVLTELLGGLREQLSVGELPAETLGQLASDLDAHTARGFRNGHDAHCPPPVTCEGLKHKCPRRSHQVADEGKRTVVQTPDPGACRRLARRAGRWIDDPVSSLGTRRNGCQGAAGRGVTPTQSTATAPENRAANLPKQFLPGCL